MAYNLHDIKVVGLEVSNILYCRIEGKLGEHSSMELCAFLENQEDFLYEMPSYQPVELLAGLWTSQRNHVLFKTRR